MLAGWKIKESELAAACDTGRFAEFYDSLYKHAGAFEEASTAVRFDKTPRYIINLPEITKITDVPVIAMIKDPRAVCWSDFRRSKRDEKEINAWYEAWMPRKKAYMQQAHEGYEHAWESEQCLVTRLENLYLNTRSTLERMFLHVGLQPSLHYLNIRESRYPEWRRGNGINISLAVQHLALLPQGIQERVRQDFGHLDRWFYAF